MRRILIVDNDTLACTMLLNEIRQYDHFRALSANSPVDAVKLFITQHIDILIAALELPGKEALKLFSHVRHHYPETHFIVIADSFSKQVLMQLKKLGVQNYFTRPVHAHELVDKILEKEKIKPPSSIYGITPASFLQLMNLEHKSCTLLFSQNGCKGVIHCLNGEVINAKTGLYSGVQAFREIMRWETPHIRINERCVNTEKLIDQPLMKLLMESHQMMDESPDEPEAQARYSSSYGKAGMDLPENNQDADHDTLALKDLEDRLSKATAVTCFEIMDEKDQLLNNPGYINSIDEISPWLFFMTADKLEGIMGGQIKYASVTRPDRSIHFIGRSKPFFIKAKLRPGEKADRVEI